MDIISDILKKHTTMMKRIVLNLISILLILQSNFLPGHHAFVSPTARCPLSINKRDGVSAFYPSQSIMKESSVIRSMSMNQQQEEDDVGILSTLSTPLDRPVLAVIDFLALLGFAAVGKASHSADGSLDILAVLSVAFPFVLSWFLTSPITGVYETSTRNKDNPLFTEATTAAKGWIVAIPLGIVLRGIVKGYTPPVPFIVVTMIATLIILCGSRVVFSIAEDFFVELVN